jgi:3-hydroxybutyryl-CoA dehydrogenase
MAHMDLMVAVVGAGAMGSGIAQVAVSAGEHVWLLDAVPGAATKGVDHITASVRRRAERGDLSEDEATLALERLHVADSVAGLPDCALIVEAVVERLDVKQQLFEDLATTQPSTTIFATNTSSLDVTAIAEAVTDPERVLGLHFFNPPPAMKLVEVVRGADTAPWLVDYAVELMREWGKTPVVCTSTPGFIVNRVARPFYGEGQRMLEAGMADAATIDACLRAGGFPMGPFELTDFIGQDVNLAVGTSVWEQTGRDPRYAPTPFQQNLVAAGHLGRKTGHGVYDYDDAGRPIGAEPDPDAVAALLTGPLLTNPLARTLAMLVNEAVDLVDRGEASEGDVDIAMTLGTRYPKGPIAWGREIGHAVVASQLGELDAAYPGGRYRPSPALGRKATR